MKHEYKLIKKCAGIDKKTGPCKITAVIDENVTVELKDKNDKSVLDKKGKPIIQNRILWFCKFHYRSMVMQDTQRLLNQELQNQAVKQALENMRKQNQEAIKKE